MTPILSDRRVGSEHVHDVLGIGFGPSNLSLSLAIHEHNRAQGGAGDRVDAIFVEKQERFGWHRGMLIDDATMQVSFLKDLVTMRDPTSAYSFVAFLRACGRLVDFMNHRMLFPLRIEFHDYLEWAAGQMSQLVDYGNEVVDVEPVRDDADEVWAFDVTIAGSRPMCAARATWSSRPGLQLRMPPGIERSARVWHNRDFHGHVERLGDRVPERFVVIGAGQSAAEVTSHLHRAFPRAEICAVFARYGYSPADDSPFANPIFDPAAVDEYFGAPADVKRMLLAYHANTNYSVVDPELIGDLCRRVHQEKVPAASGCNACGMLGVRDGDGPVVTTLQSLATGERLELESDARRPS